MYAVTSPEDREAWLSTLIGGLVSLTMPVWILQSGDPWADSQQGFLEDGGGDVSGVETAIVAVSRFAASVLLTDTQD